MSVPADHITIPHGSLILNIPRSLFKGVYAEPDEYAVKKFRKMLSERYPWLSENALDVIMKNAQRTMMETIDQETGGCAQAKDLIANGKLDEAIRHLKKHINEKNVDTMYLLGETLCKVGKTEEGYALINKARSTK